MKDPKYQSIIFDEDGEAIVQQQLIDSYYEGTTDTKKSKQKTIRKNDDQFYLGMLTAKVLKILL